MENKPTYDEILEEIEFVKLSIKLEDDYEVREKLEQELEYLQEYLENMTSKGTP